MILMIIDLDNNEDDLDDLDAIAHGDRDENLFHVQREPTLIV